jgi:hypothetical protein
LIVTAWNNGKWSCTGAGYGIRISKRDRDECFEKDWEHVIIVLDDE